MKSLLASTSAQPASKSKSRSSRAKLPAPPTTGTASKSQAAGPLPGQWLNSYYHWSSDSPAQPARRMMYWLYLPDRDSLSGMPLVVMLHGCDQTAPQFAQGTQMNRLAEEKGFAVLYPQQTLRAHPQRCWPWYEKSVQKGGGDLHLIAGTIDKVVAQFALDATRIYVAGLSAGAAMAHILALTYPHRFAAVGLHSAPVFGAGHTRAGAYAVMQGGSARAGAEAIAETLKKAGVWPTIPAILVHGHEDKVVRPVNQAQLAHQFVVLNHLEPGHAAPAVHKAAGRGKVTPANPYLIRDYSVGRKPLLRVCEIFNLGHAWSGGDCSMKYTSCNGPDASKMMWQFFARHRRPQAKSH